MEPHLREATRDDAAAIADLVTQLGYPSRTEQVATRLTALLSMDQGLLVAEVGGAVVGVVHVTRCVTLVLDDAADIGALVVDNQWRGQGIGRALLQAAAEPASCRGKAFPCGHSVRQHPPKDEDALSMRDPPGNALPLLVGVLLIVGVV